MTTREIVLATRPRPSFASPPRRFKNCRRPEEGEARKAQCQPLPRNTNKRRRLLTSRARLRAISGRARLSGASTAVLAGDFDIAGSASGHASWDADKTRDPKITRSSKSRRALPALSCPSPVTAPHASAVVPKGLMPEAAPARVASRRGSTALAPHCGSHPECVPL